MTEVTAMTTVTMMSTKVAAMVSTAVKATAAAMTTGRRRAYDGCGGHECDDNESKLTKHFFSLRV
jgi:hypothetical protein